ncbi:MAG: hypothetical protein EBS72_09340 [Rhizobiales bacterium]|nr:hypothetical protein [Hyphomicrobiales bacterium]
MFGHTAASPSKGANIPTAVMIALEAVIHDLLLIFQTGKRHPTQTTAPCEARLRARADARP